MSGKTVSAIMLSLLVIGTLTLAFKIQVVKADRATVTINADGSISPSTAPIYSADNITYALTGDIKRTYTDGIWIERDNIVLDGAGHKVQGFSGSWATGIALSGRSNVIIKNVTIEKFNNGIFLNSSLGNSISGNNMVDSIIGIFLNSSLGNSISGNNITDNRYGIYLSYSSSNNSIYHNNFVYNWWQPSSSESINVWDDGYPSGGNYWNDYNGLDLHSGPYQNVTGSDGIGDTPYTIDANNLDKYPLMNPYTTNALSASISPVSATLMVGQSKTAGAFTSIVTGGTWPYMYQWYLNDTAVQDAAFSSWTFIPASAGFYTVYLEVADSVGGRATSSSANVSVRAQVRPIPAPSFWIVPATISFNATKASIGTLFNVTVWGACLDSTYSWQVEMGWNASLMQEVNCGYSAEGTSALFAGHSTFTVVSDIDKVAGTFVIGETLIGDDMVDASSNSMFWVEFNVTATPAAGQTLTCDIDPGGVKPNPQDSNTFFLNWNGDEEMPLTTAPCAYTFAYVAPPVQDVAVTSVAADRTWVCQGWVACVNVTVSNNGDFPENVTVTLYYNITANNIIGGQAVNLHAGESTTLLFVWNTTSVPCCYTNYTLTAAATIPVDNTPADNTLSGWNITVRMLGDISGDSKIDLRDIHTAALSFDSQPGNPRWNPDADVNGDGRVDLRDIALVAKNFGRHYP